MIYGATYSGVDVLEQPTKNVAVMRRVQDGWVNATHILKVANFDKPQRTRILEREIQVGKHEKVQGGYGKYQGTWVPVDRAKSIAEQYGVADELGEILDFESGKTAPPAPKVNNKAKAASRSVSTMAQPFDRAPTAKRVRKTASTSALEAKRQLKPVVVKPTKEETRRKSGRAKKRGQSGHSRNASLADAESFSADSASVSSRSSSPSEFLSDSDLDHEKVGGLKQRSGSFKASQSSRQATSHVQSHFTPHMTPLGYQTYSPGEEEEEDGYLYHQTPGRESNGYEVPKQSGSEYDMVTAEYRNKLLDYFMAPDDDKIPDFLIHPPAGFKINQVIDDEGHTAFHWACSMGSLKIIEILLSHNANIRAVNDLGQIPLVRAIMFTNNYERRTFPKVVDLLRKTIFHVDQNKQTVLHHIASTTSSRSKLSSTRYYTEILLAKVSESQPMSVLTNFVNKQDANGDTALHIAARNGARKCVKVLLSYGASTDLVNKNGRTSQEYIYEYETQKQSLAHQRDYSMHEQLKSSSSPIQMTDYSRTPHLMGQTSNGIVVNGNSHFHDNNVTATISKSNASPNLAEHSPRSTRAVASVITHVSEAAIKATQQIAPSMMDHIEGLAILYDAELRDKEEDVEQVRELLESTKEDIASVERNIAGLSKALGDERSVSAKLQQANELVNTRALQLRKLVERSQARDLATIVQEEEYKVHGQIQQEIQATGGHFDIERNIMLSLELSSLQDNRKKLVDEIVELCASAGVGEKMNDYRRLVSLSCGVKFDEIDDLLEGIGQALGEQAET